MQNNFIRWTMAAFWALFGIAIAIALVINLVQSIQGSARFAFLWWCAPFLCYEFVTAHLSLRELVLIRRFFKRASWQVAKAIVSHHRSVRGLADLLFNRPTDRLQTEP